MEHTLSRLEVVERAETLDKPVSKGRDILVAEVDEDFEPALSVQVGGFDLRSSSRYRVIGLNTRNQVVEFEAGLQVPAINGSLPDAFLIQTENQGMSRSGFLLDSRGVLVGVLAGCSPKVCQFTPTYAAPTTKLIEAAVGR